jgi:AraC-like DNA-binding protein
MHHRATGSRSPQRYMSRMRLDNALTELAAVAQCAFSPQASFTRAFHRAAGATPTLSALAREGGGSRPFCAGPEEAKPRSRSWIVKIFKGTHETWEPTPSP